MEQLQRQLEELRKQRQEIIQKRNAEYEAIKELTIQPEAQATQAKLKKQAQQKHLTLEHRTDEVEVAPTEIAKYTRAVQADTMPERIVEIKPDYKVEIDENSRTTYDYINEATGSGGKAAIPFIKQFQQAVSSYAQNLPRSSDISIFWSSPAGHRFPTAIDWTDHSFAVANRKATTIKGEGYVALHDIGNLDKPIEIPVSAQPTTIKFVPRSDDLVIVGGATGLIYLYDSRLPQPLVTQTQRWNACHNAQVISTLFIADRQFMSIGADGSMFHWDIDSLSKPVAKDPLPNSKSQIVNPTAACMNDMGNIVIGFEDGSVITRSTAVGSKVEQLTKQNGSITSLDFRQRTRGHQSVLAVTSLDGTITIWTNNKCVNKFENLTDLYVGCCWRPCPNQYLVTARSDNVVVFSDLDQKYEKKVTLPSMASCLKFSPDGNMLTAGCLDGSIHIITCPPISE